MAALMLSALDVLGIGNLVGRNVTVSTGIVAPIDGMKTLHCLWWCIAGPAYQPWTPRSAQVEIRFSLGLCAMHFAPGGPGGLQLKSCNPNTW